MYIRILYCWIYLSNVGDRLCLLLLELIFEYNQFSVFMEAVTSLSTPGGHEEAPGYNTQGLWLQHAQGQPAK